MHGQFRASHRARAKAPFDNFGLPWHSHKASDAQPLVAGTPAEVEFEMLPMSYIFKAGHRLRLTLFFADPAAPSCARHDGAHRRCFARLAHRRSSRCPSFPQDSSK